jgi:hypothetical protein
MTKKLGLIVLLLGIALIVATALDLFKMSTVGDAAPGMGGSGSLGQWTLARLAFLAAGGVLGIWGAYGLVRKQKQA